MTARDDLAVIAAVDAEAALLGGLLLDNGAWDIAAASLHPEHFAAPLHRMVFATIARQLQAGKGADVVTVAEALSGRATLEEVHGLASYLPSASNMVRYASLIVDRHKAGQLLAAANEIADLAADHEQPIAERIDNATSMLASLASEAANGDDWTDIYAGMIEHTATLEARAEGRIVAYPTGLTGLDEETDGGPRPGQLVVLAARPAMGKSALALTIGANLAATRSVAFVTLEMSRTDVFDRLTAMLGRVPLHAVIRPNRGNGLDWGRVIGGTEAAKSLRFRVLDQPGATIRQVALRARSLKRRHGLDVLIVDYVGLMAGLDQRQNRVHQIEEITRSLKMLAKELGIVVVALAQLNRGVEQRVDQTPVLSDLRDSGAIEQDADLVMFLHRPIASKPDLSDEWREYAKLRIAKARQGRTGDIHLRYVGEQTRFEDWVGPPPSNAMRVAPLAHAAARKASNDGSI